ncbi:MAG: hypothetical protein ABJG33_00205 [Balneola sp.]
MSDIKEILTHEEQDVFYALLSVQEADLLEQAKTYSNANLYKWIHTRLIADYMDKKLSWVRYRLNKIEKTGLIKCKRVSTNNCLWSMTSIEGYKEGSYSDYFYKINEVL